LEDKGKYGVTAMVSKDVIEEAKKLIAEAKEIMKVLYQLCFIATSENPLREKAEKLIREMVERGLVSETEVAKAKMDVRRWRDLVLDKIGRRSVEEY